MSTVGSKPASSSMSREWKEIASEVASLAREHGKAIFRESIVRAMKKWLVNEAAEERREQERRRALAACGVLYGAAQSLPEPPDKEEKKEEGLCSDYKGWLDVVRGRLTLPPDMLETATEVAVFEEAKRQGLPDDPNGNHPYEFLVFGWLHYELFEQDQSGILPPCGDRELDEDEKITGLCAIHDAWFPSNETFNPWNAKGTPQERELVARGFDTILCPEGIRYWLLMHTAKRLETEFVPDVREWLEDITVDERGKESLDEHDTNESQGETDGDDAQSTNINQSSSDEETTQTAMPEKPPPPNETEIEAKRIEERARSIMSEHGISREREVTAVQQSGFILKTWHDGGLTAQKARDKWHEEYPHHRLPGKNKTKQANNVTSRIRQAEKIITRFSKKGEKPL